MTDRDKQKIALMKKMLKQHDDSMPQLLKALKKAGAGDDNYEDFQNEYAAKRRAQDEHKHAKKYQDQREHGMAFKPEDYLYLLKDEAIRNELLENVAGLIYENMPVEDWKMLAELPHYEEGEDEEQSAIEQIKMLLDDLILSRTIKSWPNEMPDVLYRGSLRHQAEEPFLGDSQGNMKISEEPHVFVSTEPSVAAAYHRFGSYTDRANTLPTNYGDYVWQIRTYGLDPSKFVKDDESTLWEALFGPQYIYKGAIPQEEIEITDKAGNTRRVPRIEKVHYTSDALCKQVIHPRRLIDAVRRF